MESGLPSGVKVGFKIYILRDNAVVAGEGLVEILEAIEEAGSLYSAAHALKMNYRKLWTKLSLAERILGIKLVDRGRGRQGSRLTDAGRSLIKLYREYHDRVSLCVEANT